MGLCFWRVPGDCLKGLTRQLSSWENHGCGSKLNRRGYAGFGPWFHLPGFHFGIPVFWSHSHINFFGPVLPVPYTVAALKTGKRIVQSGVRPMLQRWGPFLAPEEKASNTCTEKDGANSSNRFPCLNRSELRQEARQGLRGEVVAPQGVLHLGQRVL